MPRRAATVSISKPIFVGYGIIKGKLLHDSGVLAVSWKRVASAIFPRNDFMDPGVDRRRPDSAVGKETDTVGHFISNSPDCFQRIEKFHVGQV